MKNLTEEEIAYYVLGFLFAMVILTSMFDVVMIIYSYVMVMLGIVATVWLIKALIEHLNGR